MYYIRRLRLGHADKVVPPVICVADGRQAFFTGTSKWRKFYSNDTKYDWELAPSTPDGKLVADLASFAETDSIKVFDVLAQDEYEMFNERLTQHRAKQLVFDFRVKKLITEDNFEEVFDYWHKCFGEAVRNGTKSSRYFLCDIQESRSVYDRKENKVVFLIGPKEQKAKKILPKEYEWFWSNYEKVTDTAAIRNILTKVDRLTDEPIRRFTGEFFTPVPFGAKLSGTSKRLSARSGGKEIIVSGTWPPVRVIWNGFCRRIPTRAYIYRRCTQRTRNIANACFPVRPRFSTIISMTTLTASLAGNRFLLRSPRCRIT